MNTFEPARLHDSFAGLQERFNGQITISETHLNGGADNPFERQPVVEQGFHQLEVSAQELRSPAFKALLGSVVLFPNRQLQALSPAVLTDKPTSGLRLTMLDQPYDPKVGFTPGLHFGLSVKAQTETSQFGGHGSAGAYEGGHFGAVLLGARDPAIGQRIIRSGDQASDGLIQAGLPDGMANSGMLNVRLKSVTLNPNNPAKLTLFWHAGLLTETGIAKGDYPNAVKLMLGAGAIALGRQGVDSARRLVDHAIKGAQY